MEVLHENDRFSTNFMYLTPMYKDCPFQPSSSHSANFSTASCSSEFLMQCNGVLGSSNSYVAAGMTTVVAATSLSDQCPVWNCHRHRSQHRSRPEVARHVPLLGTPTIIRATNDFFTGTTAKVSTKFSASCLPHRLLVLDLSRCARIKALTSCIRIHSHRIDVTVLDQDLASDTLS